MTREIPLTQGKVALVDDEDYEFLVQYKWHFSSGCARRGKNHQYSMHHTILAVSAGTTVRHIDGNRINNQKGNLQLSKYRYNHGGYIRIYEPDHPIALPQGVVAEHRKVWYEAHGDIPNGHHIHHINGDKSDNRIENLACLSHSEHSRQHTPWNVGTASMVSLVCDVCGKEFERLAYKWRDHQKKGLVNTCCSRRCAGIVARKIQLGGTTCK